MSSVKSDAQLIAEGQFVVSCTYFDSTASNYSVELNVNAAIKTCEHKCHSLSEAHQHIVSLRKHAAHSQTVALISITVLDVLNSSDFVWSWGA